ncbi:MAG TPA: HNH endonuclease signature motif containing protein [Acidimicrobiia bacterium]|nr:HNH endonuclease signature motif containing protein [Acidimicrobiia bacterium]
MRRALIARDRHCTWKGCDRDPRWCDVHHDIAWADGGKTDPTNCRLLCRFHHVLTHLLADQNRAPPTHT